MVCAVTMQVLRAQVHVFVLNLSCPGKCCSVDNGKRRRKRVEWLLEMLMNIHKD